MQAEIHDLGKSTHVITVGEIFINICEIHLVNYLSVTLSKGNTVINIYSPVPSFWSSV